MNKRLLHVGTANWMLLRHWYVCHCYRKMRLEDSDWVNVTLRDVQIADSGMYSCSDDEKRLRVVESGMWYNNSPFQYI